MSEVGERLDARLVDILLDRIAETRYPSPTMLDRTERAITTMEQAEAYVDRLIDLVEQDRYPSPTMLDRVTRLTHRL